MATVNPRAAENTANSIAQLPTAAGLDFSFHRVENSLRPVGVVRAEITGTPGNPVRRKTMFRPDQGGVFGCGKSEQVALTDRLRVAFGGF